MVHPSKQGVRTWLRTPDFACPAEAVGALAIAPMKAGVRS
jgi:hypothetical protein